MSRDQTDAVTLPLFSDAPLPPTFADPNARNTDPETSHAAATDATLRASEGRLAAMRLLAERPMTDFELAARSGLQQTSIGKRRGECMGAGLVRALVDEDGETITRQTPSGSRATVWCITLAGYKWLAANEATK